MIDAKVRSRGTPTAPQTPVEIELSDRFEGTVVGNPPSRLVVSWGRTELGPGENGREVVSWEQLKRWIRNGSILSRLGRYESVRLVSYRADVLVRPMLTMLLLRALTRGSCRVEDQQGIAFAVTVRELARRVRAFLRAFRRKGTLIQAIDADVERIIATVRQRHRGPRVDLSARPVYLRTDLWFGMQSGGSIGHIAGVINNLHRFAGQPILFTTDSIPTVAGDIDTRRLDPPAEFWDFRGLPNLRSTEPFIDSVQRELGGERPAFIYQRYSVCNYTGVKLARAYAVPLVLEYNGSEIWVSRNWGRPLNHEALANRIELLNLQAAELIVVVSKPLRDELVGRGIELTKILVNPNGVDPVRYSPAVDGGSVRERYNLIEKTVIGFIGTFDKWHGAELLAEGFGRLLQQRPELRETTRLLMIGDGVTMPQVREKLRTYGGEESAVLTGLVPQAEGPAHLAACDILVSPHVPNPDGTPFFGSPTKLFEYMAMGKGIVASDLDQIGEVLRDGETALLGRPGDPDDLANGLSRLIDDPALRLTLGRAAREEVLRNYTWREHTQRIVTALQERCTER